MWIATEIQSYFQNTLLHPDYFSRGTLGNNVPHDLFLIFLVKKVKAVAPEVTKPLENMLVKDGAPGVFKCQIKGAPVPEIVWFREGKVLKPSSDFQQSYVDDVATLTIGEIFPDDAGQFKCEAKNEAGKVETVMKLSIEGKRFMSILLKEKGVE